MKSINFFTDLLLVFIVSDASAWIIRNATETLTGTKITVNKTEMENDGLASMPKSRRKRYISQSDMIAILDYHNNVRANVFPPAANMEYMLWNEDLARSAEAWAATCIWEHGPPYLLRYLGQNLSVRTGNYHSILQLVKPWYDEVRDYVFPYPHDCNPHCPMRCYGPMCTHYTQMVWASSNRVGCAIQTCYNMVVWGIVWREATYLVCNYSPKLVMFLSFNTTLARSFTLQEHRVYHSQSDNASTWLRCYACSSLWYIFKTVLFFRGNWIGEAPYRVGVPCSACPPSYGGSCSNNMCFPAINSNFMYWFK
uniref:Peptidase inhibitor 15b n=1 Tax=Cyprinus carpio TaxID=7962 RepID=A0A8C2A7V9_CYPCA